MICAGSRDLSSSGLATTADPPTGGCHGTGLKHPVKVARRSEPKDDHKAEHMYSYRHFKYILYSQHYSHVNELI